MFRILIKDIKGWSYHMAILPSKFSVMAYTYRYFIGRKHG